MAETLAAAIQLVGVGRDTVLFIDKVAKARQEAKTLYREVKRLERLLQSIRDFLQKNPRRASAPEERLVEKNMKESLGECRKCLEALNHELEPLTQIPRGKISGFASQLKWVLTDKFIKYQGKQIDRNLQILSISLHLLQNYSNKELVEQQRELLVGLIREIHQSGLDLQTSSPNSSEPDVRQSQIHHDLTQVRNEIIANHHLTENEPTEEKGNVEDPHDTSDDEDSSGLDTALKIAVKHNQDNIVRGLRQSGANVRMKDSEHLTLLHFAVHRDAEKALDALLDTEQELPRDWLDAQSKQGRTALMYTGMFGDRDKSVVLARSLISRGCNVNIKDPQDRSAICFAMDGVPSAERKDLVALLLDSNAEREPAVQWDKEQAMKYFDLQQHASTSQQRQPEHSEISQRQELD